MNRRIRNILTILVAGASLIVPAAAYASLTPTLTQTVNAGVLSANIMQSDDSTPVASPAVGFAAVNRSFNCQTNTATLGDTSNKLSVTNLDTTNTTGWTLAINATTAGTGTWTDGSSHTYKYNDAASTAEGAGCANGQLTINPASGSITPDCNSVCDAVTVNKGSSTAMSGSTAVALMTTSSGTAWKGYMTGVGFSQKIPGGQASGTYSLPMTITIAAN